MPDLDDAALAGRFRGELPLEDALLMTSVPDAALAASVREALAQQEGYLRDAAIMFGAWDFRLADVAIPTSIVCGELDRTHPPRNSRWLARQVPGSTLTVLPDTGHLGALMDGWDRLLAATP